MSRSSRAPAAAFDTSVALLALRVGRYPLGHGPLGVVRSLGRVGVPAYAVTEDRYTPVARSRYLTRAFVEPTTGREDTATLLEMLDRVAARLPGPAVVIATDDEAAVLLAEHAPELGPKLIVPAVPRTLPRTLASKRRLAELCREHGFATPDATAPRDRREVRAFARSATFPVVAKNDEAFARLCAPAVAHTTVVATPEELLARAAGWPEPPGVVLQEYVPDDVAQDWIFHGYFDASSRCLVAFTGVKYRSWPPRTGVTTFARAVDNEPLAESVRAFASAIGYRGILDLDVRHDRRDGRYKLVDFNPRIGAQFRLFETDAGIDVARAMHLDLTGRPVPSGRPVAGRGFAVEHLDLAARLAGRRGRGPADPGRRARGPVERAWFAADDPLPFGVMAARAPSLLRDRLRAR